MFKVTCLIDPQRKVGTPRKLGPESHQKIIFELFSNRKWSWTWSIAQWATGGTGSRWTTDRASVAASQRMAGTTPPCVEPRHG
jgi:hypothetical protein